MSVRLNGIRTPAGHKDAGGPLFDGLNFSAEKGARVGVLGAPKSGKSTLLRLICGTAHPEAGTIERNARISWPIPLNSFFLGELSAIQNVRFVARLYGIEDDAFPRRVAEMIELPEHLNVSLKECPRTVRPRLAFALGVSMDFDIYLFDGSFAPPGDKEFKEKAGSILAERMAGRGYVLAAAKPDEIEQNCDSVYVLEAGQATFFASVEEGVKHFKAQSAAVKKKRKAGGPSDQIDQDEDDEGVLSDINILGSVIADAVD